MSCSKFIASEFHLCDYDREFLTSSLTWLNDPEIQDGMDIHYTIVPEKQEEWFSRLTERSDYKIWGFKYGVLPIGAGGFRNITAISGELTCYIGDKRFWGGTGAILISLLEEKAREYKFLTIFLKVLITNQRAYNLYIKKGYKEISRDSKFIKMQKKLI